MEQKLATFSPDEKEIIFEEFQNIFLEKLNCILHLQSPMNMLRGECFSYASGIATAYLLHKIYIGDF